MPELLDTRCSPSSAFPTILDRLQKKISCSIWDAAIVIAQSLYGSLQSTNLLNRDCLSDIVQTRGLPDAMRDVGRCRSEAIDALQTLYRQVVVGGQRPDHGTSRALIDLLRSIGATTAVLQACRLLTDLPLAEIRRSLFPIMATALLSCEQAIGYMRELESGFEELTAIGIGCQLDWSVEDDGASTDPVVHIV